MSDPAEENTPFTEEQMSGLTVRERERQRFIESCTQRDLANGPMPTDELLERLDISLSALKEAMANPNEKRLPMAGADCLRGALIRLSQAYSHSQVSAKVYELISLTTDIQGI